MFKLDFDMGIIKNKVLPDGYIKLKSSSYQEDESGCITALFYVLEGDKSLVGVSAVRRTPEREIQFSMTLAMESPF